MYIGKHVSKILRFMIFQVSSQEIWKLKSTSDYLISLQQALGERTPSVLQLHTTLTLNPLQFTTKLHHE